MRNSKLKVLIPIIISVLVPVLSFAVPINAEIPGSQDASSPLGIIGNFYEFALLAGGIIALIAIIYGAIKYATSGGNSSKQSDARDQITQALIGLLLLLGAYIILNTINPSLTAPSLPDPNNPAGIQ